LKKKSNFDKLNPTAALTQFVQQFTSTTVLLILSPFFVIAMVTGGYIVAIVILIIIGALTIIKRSNFYLIILPPLFLIFYLVTLLFIIPNLISLANLMDKYLTGIGAILIIVLFCITFGFFIFKLPDLNIPKLGKITISVILAKALGALLIVFILEPIIILLFSVDYSELANTAADPNVQAAIGLSTGMALLATIASLILGVPLGYLLARRTFVGRSFIQSIVDVPIVMPHLVSGIALLMVFGANGIIGAPLDSVGVRFVDAWPGIVIAMMFVSVPFVVNSARDGFSAVDPRLEKVGRSLGGTRVQVFSKVALPLSIKPIISGAIMCWARAISEFGTVIVLVYFPMIASTLIYDRFTSFGLVSVRPVAVLLILICLGVIIILRFIGGFGTRRTIGIGLGGVQ
jgi:molybdate/tungstate transport system permease protein